MDYQQLSGKHDLRICDWGPYGKRMIGLSHIADPARGVRFDFCAAPGFYRRKTDLPNVRKECGYHPWEASADLSFFTHRHELEWQDRVFCDISFAPVEENVRVMRCRMVNRTPSYQNLTLHLFSSLQYPPYHPVVARLPDGARWVDALDYASLQFATPRPVDNLACDALRPGQIRTGGFVRATGIGMGFGREAGDGLEYRFALPQSMKNRGMLLRYRMEAGQRLILRVEGDLAGVFELTGTGEAALATFAPGALTGQSLSAGEATLRLVSEGGAAVELDGMVLAEAGQLGASSFELEDRTARPQAEAGPVVDSRLMRYAGLPQTYGIWWSGGDYCLREHQTDSLDDSFYERVHDHVSTVCHGRGAGHYEEVFLRPLVLEPESERVVFALVAQGDADWVAGKLAQYAGQDGVLEAAYNKARAGAILPQGNPDGEAHRMGQQLMAATTLSNCVYPAFAKQQYIRHHSPGRWWDSLYTWDSGFIGLGLLELDQDRAIDNLNAYVTEPGDNECAFVHHGSPVPVQQYLLLELWNRTQDRAMLAYFYPRLKQYYEFLAGRLGSSDTRLPSGLLATWSYFYNSGGWDDYPPQKYFHDHREELEGRAAPAVGTSHAVRSAKILIAAARELGLEGDIPAYEEDIRIFSQALERLSWDEEAGCYGYVRHDRQGNPQGLLRHESGANFNLGLDGLSPLVADLCGPDRRARLYALLQSPEHYWTGCGLSTVDQSAPYYLRDGYWNGAVWMPHQWFFWKAALDHGQGEFAWRIAQRALELWSRETGASYNCFEHFIIASGRGAGWHHFGGLSAPVLNWFGAYFRPGRLTCGHNGWVKRLQFSADQKRCKAELELNGADATTAHVLVTLTPGTYQAHWNGAAVPCRMRTQGCCEVELPAQGKGCLVVA